MPPRRASAAPALPPGLDDDAVAELRRQVGDGGRPRVVLLSGSAGLPAGTRGAVVRVGDPSDGDEHITVRVEKDELPFAPAELTLAGRGTSRAVEQAVAARSATPAARRASAARPPRAGAATRATTSVATPSAATPAATAGGTTPAVPTQPPARTGRRTRPAASGVPTVTLTLRFAAGEWTLDAERGSKRVGRPRPLAAGAVKDAAAALGDSGVDALVAETLDAHRAEVQGRAAALRAELAALEATLHRLDG